MEYRIAVTVESVDGNEEFYRRTVALPEQLPMLRQDVESAINVYEDQLMEAAKDVFDEMKEAERIREEGE